MHDGVFPPSVPFFVAQGKHVENLSVVRHLDWHEVLLGHRGCIAWTDKVKLERMLFI
jgi:hypothetical protein